MKLLKPAVTLFSILGLASASLADPETGQPSAQTNSIIFQRLLSPADSVLMTNAEFRLFSGGKIFFKNDIGYQSFHAADLNANVLAALHVTSAQLEMQQKNLDAANQRYKEQVVAALAAPDFKATDIFGKTVRLSDYKGKIVVLEAYRSVGCPYCEAHYRTGAMQELQREATSNGVVWLLINFDSPHMGETTAKAKQDWSDRKMAITDYIIDTDGLQIGRRYSFKCAPSAVVIAQDGTVAYQGAVDEIATTTLNEEQDRATVGTTTFHVPFAELLTGNYVRAAVQALLAGKRPLVTHTRSYGCPLANLYQ
jgi:peroxiredoxin